MPEQKALVLIDGECGLCDRTARYIIDHDPKEQYSFATMQSKTGSSIMKKHDLSIEKNTVYLIEGSKSYDRSTAVFKIARKLNGPAILARPLIILPKFFRDAIYTFIARHRRKIPGSKKCANVEKYRQRFIDL